MNALLFGLALAAPAQPPLPPFPPPVEYPAAPLPPPVLTHDEFARVFRPTPGVHSVWLVHPKTKCPVFVSFTLPPGCPKVKRGSRYLEFDYGKKEVEIRFKHNGSVQVEY